MLYWPLDLKLIEGGDAFDGCLIANSISAITAAYITHIYYIIAIIIIYNRIPTNTHELFLPSTPTDISNNMHPIRNYECECALVHVCCESRNKNRQKLPTIVCKCKCRVAKMLLCSKLESLARLKNGGGGEEESFSEHRVTSQHHIPSHPTHCITSNHCAGLFITLSSVIISLLFCGQCHVSLCTRACI